MAISQIKDFINTQTTMNDTDYFPLQETAGTTKKTLWASIKSNLKAYFDTLYVSVSTGTSLKTASYVILDNDGITRVECDTTAGDMTITLPLKSNNRGRIIEIANIKGGTYKVIIATNATDATTLSNDALSVIWIPKIGDFVKLQESVNSGYWEIVNERITSQLRIDTYAGYGSTDNKIMRFANSVENVGNMFSENHSTGYSGNAKGLEITINKSGRYSIAVHSNSSASASNMGLTLNASSLTTVINGCPSSEVLAFQTTAAGGSSGVVTINLYFKKGDIIRSQGTGDTPTTSGQCHFSCVYLGN